MSLQTKLVPTDELEAEQLPPIKNDEIAEEVFAARRYAKRLTRTVVMGQTILLILFAVCVYGLAVRPPKRIYIKLDDLGHATPVKYSDLEHYTPDAAVAKNYLSNWATFRYGRLRASVSRRSRRTISFWMRSTAHRSKTETKNRTSLQNSRWA